MKTSQMNSLNMANATTAFLDKNLSIFTANTKVTSLLTTIKASVATINQTAITQGLNSTGATNTKKALHKIAADKAEHVSNGLESYYEDINDLTLVKQFHYTTTDFYNAPAVEIINRMQLIHDKAASILPAPATMQTFNVSAADITDLQTAINNFTNAVPGKKIMQATSSAATELLITHFATLRLQLRKLDKLINTYRVMQPGFVEGYFNVRKISNIGKSAQVVKLDLAPQHFESIFGKKFSEGDTFTVRNHSQVSIELFLTDLPNQLPEQKGISIEAGNEIKVSVSKDFNNQFAHWLLVYNPNKIDKSAVTIILARGKSQSKAKPIGNKQP